MRKKNIWWVGKKNEKKHNYSRFFQREGWSFFISFCWHCFFLDTPKFQWPLPIAPKVAYAPQRHAHIGLGCAISMHILHPKSPNMHKRSRCTTRFGGVKIPNGHPKTISRNAMCIRCIYGAVCLGLPPGSAQKKRWEKNNNSGRGGKKMLKKFWDLA